MAPALNPLSPDERNPSRAMDRDPSFYGIPPEFIDAWNTHGHAWMQGRSCNPEWWDHSVQEFRLASAAETQVFIRQILAPDLKADGFWLRIQFQYDQFINNILTTNGAQASLLSIRVIVRDQALNRDFTAARRGGEWYVPYCVKTGDTIRVLVTANNAAQITNSPVRVRCETSVGAPLPELQPFDDRRNTMRTFSVTLAPGVLVPTIAIGAASVFVATIPNRPWFIVPNSLQLLCNTGSAQVLFHGISVAGAIDAGGMQVPVGLVPVRVGVDRLDKIAFSKPGVGAAVLTMTFDLYD